MEDPDAVVRTESSPHLYAQESKTLQEFRTDFRPEIKELRVILTGIRYHNGQKIIVFENAMICERHFSELMPLIHLPSTKAWTLSRVHEEKAEMYVIGIMDSIDRWLMSRCWICPQCGLQGEYSNKSNVMMTIEAFLYGNMNRSVAGFEAELLAQMQQVTSREDYIKQHPKTSSIAGMMNIFRRRS